MFFENKQVFKAYCTPKRKKYAGLISINPIQACKTLRYTPYLGVNRLPFATTDII